MGGHVKGRRFMQGASTSFIAQQCNNEEPKRKALTGTVKGHGKHEFTCHPNSSHDVPSTS
jgi:hypothetical protein